MSWYDVPTQITQILSIVTGMAKTLNQIQAKETKMAAALADLQAAEAAVAAAVQSAITLIQGMKAGSVADADVEAVVTQLQTAAGALSAAVTAP